MLFQLKPFDDRYFSSLTCRLILQLLFLVTCDKLPRVGQNNVSGSLTKRLMWEAWTEGQRSGEASREMVSIGGTITCLLGWKRSADSQGGTQNLVSSVGVIMALL